MSRTSPSLRQCPRGFFICIPPPAPRKGRILRFYKKRKLHLRSKLPCRRQLHLRLLAQASLKHTNTLCPIFFYMPPKNLRAPSLRRSESACICAEGACKRGAGASARMRPRARGGQINTRSHPSFVLRLEDRSAPGAATPPRLARSARRSAPMSVRTRRAGAPRGWTAPRGASCVFTKNANFTCALGASFTKARKYPLSHLLLYATQKPSRALAPKERKRLQECAQARVQA